MAQDDLSDDELLDYLAPPEYLVAAYLVLLAREQEIEVRDDDLPEEFWGKALAECRKYIDDSDIKIDELGIGCVRQALENFDW